MAAADYGQKWAPGGKYYHNDKEALRRNHKREWCESIINMVLCHCVSGHDHITTKVSTRHVLPPSTWQVVKRNWMFSKIGTDPSCSRVVGKLSKTRAKAIFELVDSGLVLAIRYLRWWCFASSRKIWLLLSIFNHQRLWGGCHRYCYSQTETHRLQSSKMFTTQK